MKISGRNKLSGTVENIKKDGVSAQVDINVSGSNRVVATITSEAADELGLKVGDSVQALIKASNVMVLK